MNLPLRTGLALAALLLTATASRADVTATSEFGYEGSYVVGCINPVRVELASSEREDILLALEVRPPAPLSGAASDSVLYRTEVFLAAGAKKRVTLPVLVREDLSGPWRLTIRTDRRTGIRHGQKFEDGRALTVDVGNLGGNTFGSSMEPGEPLVGVLSATKSGLSWLERLPKQNNNFRGLRQDPADVVRVPSLALIPPASAPSPWLCYEGMDALLWVAPNPEEFSDDAQMDAVLQYVANGGHLVVVLTPDAAVSATSPLLPALAGLPSRYRDVTLPEVVVATTGPTSGGLQRTPVAVARFDQAPKGRVIKRLKDRTPLIIRREWGLGLVTTVTFDLTRLSSLPNAERDRMLVALLGPLCMSPLDGGQTMVGATQQPVSAHLKKRFLQAPPLPLLVLGLILYVLAIGPVDYFWLKRKKKLRRTVVTFPAIVIGFTLLAYGGSFLLFGGASGKARVAWVDFATAPSGDADVMRGLDIVGTYSPTGTTIDVAYDVDHAFIEGPWFGIGSSSWDRSAGTGIEAVVQYGQDGRPQAAVDVPLRSHRTVSARWSKEVPVSLDARIIEKDGKRVLEIHNGLGVRIRDLAYVEGSRKWQLTDVLEPGEKRHEALADGEARVANPQPEFPHLPDRLAAPWGGEGLFQSSDFRGRFESDYFVPDPVDDAGKARARRRMAHAAMGVTFAGQGAANAATQRPARVLARQGLDLSNAVSEGRGILLGWCDKDPTGLLPSEGRFDSTVVVVRRLLPYTSLPPLDEKENR